MVAWSARWRRDDCRIDVVPDMLMACGSPCVNAGERRRQCLRAPHIGIDEHDLPQPSGVPFEGGQMVRLGNRAAADHGHAQRRGARVDPARRSAQLTAAFTGNPRTKAPNSRTDEARSRNRAPQ